MIVKLFGLDRRITEVTVTGPIYQHLMIGITGRGIHEGSVIAVRGIAGLTDGLHDTHSTDGWLVYVNRNLWSDLNLLRARPFELDDAPAVPAFIGADDPLDIQLAFVYGTGDDRPTYQIGNRANLVGDDPLVRVDPETVVSVSFDLKYHTVDVTLA